MRFPNNPANRTEILLNDNITQLTKLANCVDTGTNLVKVDIEDATISVEGTNLATKENQQTMIDKSIRGINNTGSIGDGSENATAVCLGYDRGNGKARALLVDGNGAMINDPSKEGLVVANGTTTALHSMMLGNSDGTNLRTVKVDADGHLQVDVLSGAGGGDASAANQTTMITKLGEIDTAQDLTNSKLDTIAGDTTSIDGKITACNTGAVVVSSGAITETNSSAILADTASIDGKITACNTGAVVISSGTISLPAGASTEAKQTDIDNAIDTMSAKLPASLGQKANSSSFSICRSSTAGAFDASARTTIGTASTSTKLLCDSAGRLAVNNGLQTSLLECHQTGTSSTTITIADGSNSATKNITLNDIRMAQLTPDVIGYRIENGGTGGSGTDVNMEVSFDGTNYVEILTNLVGLAKSNYIGNLGDDAVGLPTLAQAFRFKISNNSGGSADYKVSLIAYGLDFAQA